MSSKSPALASLETGLSWFQRQWNNAKVRPEERTKREQNLVGRFRAPGLLDQAREQRDRAAQAGIVLSSMPNLEYSLLTSGDGIEAFNFMVGEGATRMRPLTEALMRLATTTYELSQARISIDEAVERGQQFAEDISLDKRILTLALQFSKDFQHTAFWAAMTQAVMPRQEQPWLLALKGAKQPNGLISFGDLRSVIETATSDPTLRENAKQYMAGVAQVTQRTAAETLELLGSVGVPEAIVEDKIDVVTHVKGAIDVIIARASGAISKEPAEDAYRDAMDELDLHPLGLSTWVSERTSDPAICGITLLCMTNGLKVLGDPFYADLHDEENRNTITKLASAIPTATQIAQERTQVDLPPDQTWLL